MPLYPLGNYRKIVETGELWLSSPKGFNDAIDRKSGDYGTFTFCFSTGTAENLALWYLYSGVDGKGGRIRFTKNNVKRLKTACRLFLCEKGEVCSENGIELEQGRDVEVDVRDVVYIDVNDKKNCVIRYNNETNCKLPYGEYDVIKKSKKFFLKKTMWYHEKETRLVAELTREGRKLLKPNTEYVIVLKLPNNLRNKIKIEFAPECRRDSMEFLDKKPNIKAYMESTDNVNFSKFSGEVEMKLLEKVCECCKNKK